jgi:hypothetical protein
VLHTGLYPLGPMAKEMFIDVSAQKPGWKSVSTQSYPSRRQRVKHSRTNAKCIQILYVNNRKELDCPITTKQ